MKRLLLIFTMLLISIHTFSEPKQDLQGVWINERIETKTCTICGKKLEKIIVDMLNKGYGPFGWANEMNIDPGISPNFKDSYPQIIKDEFKRIEYSVGIDVCQQCKDRYEQKLNQLMQIEFNRLIEQCKKIINEEK